jgi:hypothetical protein
VGFTSQKDPYMHEHAPPRGGRRPRAPSRPARSRSAVSSGRQLFIDGDPNSAWSRRFHDLVVGHVADAGGQDLLSDAKLSLIRCAAVLRSTAIKAVKDCDAP